MRFGRPDPFRCSVVGVRSAHGGQGGGDDDLQAQTAVDEEGCEFVAAFGLGFAVADAIVLV
jgi:hypothetical protein